MSFFSSLVANVTSGVANLGLGSRRFSLSRQDSNEGNVADLSGAKTVATPPSITVTSTSNLSTQHGFPKVVPSPSASIGQVPSSSLRRPSSRGTIETMVPSRQGSFRQQQRHSPVQPVAALDRPPLAFCKRRMSWPEIDASSTSR
ncbi:hypothetical protein PVAND_009740 [Polypedilum vanderplanki]|uniref:Uncharacterized protein n=1 Tax=Polypedilum vanderplanki TaxID=319348 RepID=A0A9J6CE47_POLVA|nr:hypothetical protein PVAND_009740 [Polypedilum vanderplanki]